MKKIFTLISALIVYTSGVWAQATPNAGFENWTTYGSWPTAYTDPDGWESANSQTAIVQTFSCVEATGADVHSGNSAVKLITKNLLGNDVPGVVTTGTLPTSMGSPITGGIPYTLRPDSIAGWYKYTPQGGDNGFAEFFLFGSAANNADTVAKAKFNTPAATVGTYTRFSAPLVYFSANAVANSIWLLSSSKDDVNLVINSVIYVDDLELIFNPPVTIAVSSQTDVSCFGDCTGSATASASDGTPPYTYLWSSSAGNQTTAMATGLCSGTHTVTVTTTTGGTASVSVTITQPATAITVNVSTTNASCGSADGTATANASGGTGTLNYSWSTGATTTTITGLVAGAYVVTVTDSNECTQTATANVSNDGGPVANITSQTNVSCNGDNNGTATVTATGGGSPYIYLWNTAPQQTTQTATGLVAGNYSVNVTDTNTCVGVASVTITEPDALSATTTSTPDSGNSNGTASVFVSGGTEPYDYLWSDANTQTTATATGLAAGDYSVIITDTNNCTYTDSASVTTSVGIKSEINNPRSEIKIYPNPAAHNIFIEANDAKSGVYDIKILNISGQVIFTGTFEHTGGMLRKEVELGESKAGLVLVKIISEDACFVLPLMKAE